MQKLQIISGPEGKTRTFSVDLIAEIEADHMWSGGNTSSNTSRPVWMAYAGSEQQSRMFSANFLQGKIAETSSYRSKSKFQILKSAGYQAHTKKIGSGVITTVYLPELFWIDPGMVDPDKIAFILLTSQEWRDTQKFDIEAAREFVTVQGIRNQGKELTDEGLKSILAEAVLFHMYLDRRTRYPMPAHPHFSLRLMMRCLQERLARRHDPYGGHIKYSESGMSYLNIPPTLAFYASHEDFGNLLAQEVALWHA